jgi:hypothetical protein
MVRSPYAVAEGIHRRTGVPIEDAAEHWTTANRILLDDLEHLQNVIRVDYEEFCSSPLESLARIQRFLGLETPFGPDSITDLRIHNIEDKVGGIQNFNAKSLNRLSPEDRSTIERIAGPLMRELGYARVS